MWDAQFARGLKHVRANLPVLALDPVLSAIFETLLARALQHDTLISRVNQISEYQMRLWQTSKFACYATNYFALGNKAP